MISPGIAGNDFRRGIALRVFLDELSAISCQCPYPMGELSLNGVMSNFEELSSGAPGSCADCEERVVLMDRQRRNDEEHSTLVGTEARLQHVPFPILDVSEFLTRTNGLSHRHVWIPKALMVTA